MPEAYNLKLIYLFFCCRYNQIYTAMSLEEELQTTNFQNLQHKTALNVLFTSAWLRNRTQCIFKQFGLSSEQFNVLRILRGQFPKTLSLKEITARMLERNSNTTRIVEKLVNKALIQRDHSQEDKRELQIQITTQGLEVLSEIDACFEQDKTHEVPHLTQAECKTLNKLLDKMRG